MRNVLNPIASINPADTVQRALPQYPNPEDQTTGSALLFPYSTTGRTSYPTYTYAIIRSNLAIITNSENYFLSASGHVNSIWRGPGNVVTNPNQFDTHVYSFTYTRENIATIVRNTFKSNDYINVYEYDTKINPFFGSTDPSLDDTQRFSLNNVTKITTIYPNSTQQTVVYQYEYNQQGLPTKRTTIQGGTDVFIYIYETY